MKDRLFGEISPNGGLHEDGLNENILRKSKNNLRGYVARFALVLLGSLFVVYFAITISTVNVNENITKMFTLSEDLEELSTLINDSNTNIEKYLATKDSDAFIAYLDNKKELVAATVKYSYGNSYDITQLKLSSISNILTFYIEEADNAISYKRARDTYSYINSYNNLEDMTNYVSDIITDINNLEIGSNMESHRNLSRLVDELKVVFILMTIIMIALCLVFVYDFTDKVIHPIEILSKRAREVSNGNYDISLVDSDYFDEANVLSSSFNDMTINIKNFISELQDKANTENRLRTSEIDNLKMQNLLKQAELVALQTQINPHFLFNTLNAAVGLANLEDAERTSEFLYHLSSLFRYNLSGLSSNVTLSDEIKNVKDYGALMKVRFGDRIDFVYNINEEDISIDIPPLILQPVIENSFIHGFKDKEEDCVITINVSNFTDYTLIEVRDNGIGINEDILNNLKSTNYSHSGKEKVIEDGYDDHHGHTTGLGMNNVYERLKGYYGRDDVFSIQSEEGHGTSVFLKVYHKKL